MRIPAEAGETIVDLRPIGRLPYQRVFVTIGLVLLFGIAFGSPDGWKLGAFFFGPVAVLTWLLLHAFRLALVVCEHGLVVRNFVRVTFVPWSNVRGLRSRPRYSKGRSSYPLYLIDAGGRPIRLPGPATRRADIDRQRRAVDAIVERAGVSVEREARR